MSIYIGIDPGFSGAWGLVDHHGAYVSCGEMVHDGHQIYTEKVVHEIRKFIYGEHPEIVIEAVHAMPGQGVSSSFKFGVAYGAALAIAEKLRGTTHLVSPRVWKKEMDLTSDKDLSLDMARALWPEAPIKLKKHNGRAEALLMAEWYRRHDLQV